MAITYDQYPLLQKIEKSRRHLSTDLPLGGFSKKGATFATKNTNLGFLIGALTRKAGLEDHPLSTHFYLDGRSAATLTTPETAEKYLEHSLPLEAAGGVILLEDGVQLLYLVLPKAVAKELLHRDKPYIAIALFKGEALGAFEHGEMEGDQLLLDAGGRFDDVNVFGAGGYIGFAMTVLARFAEMQRPRTVTASFNKTRHKIFRISIPKWGAANG